MKFFSNLTSAQSSPSLPVAEERPLDQLDLAELKATLYRDVLGPIVDQSVASKITALESYAANNSEVGKLKEAVQLVSTELLNIQTFAYLSVSLSRFS